MSLTRICAFRLLSRFLYHKPVFVAPDWVPKLPFEPPDSIPISEFMLNETYGRHPYSDSRPPFTCELIGVEYSALEVLDRVDKLAKSLSQELQWSPNKGTEWEKVCRRIQCEYGT